MGKPACLFALAMLLSGCVTAENPVSRKLASTIFCTYPATDGTQSLVEYIVEKDNDLYIMDQRYSAGGFYVNYDTRRITNTPLVKETDVKVSADYGVVIYFAHEPAGGKWYMQPRGSDDSDRKETDAAGSLKPATEKSVESNMPSSADEILKYKKLLDEGAITKEEYEQKKKQLLGLYMDKP